MLFAGCTHSERWASFFPRSLFPFTTTSLRERTVGTKKTKICKERTAVRHLLFKGYRLALRGLGSKCSYAFYIMPRVYGVWIHHTCMPDTLAPDTSGEPLSFSSIKHHCQKTSVPTASTLINWFQKHSERERRKSRVLDTSALKLWILFLKISYLPFSTMKQLATPPSPVLFSSSCLRRRSWLPVMTLQVSGCPHHIRNQEMLIYTFWVSWDSSQIPGYTQKPWRLPAAHSITQAGPFWTPVHWKCKFSSWKYASMPLLAMPPPPLLFSSSCLRRRSWLPVMTLQVSGCPHHIRNQEMLIYTFWVSWDSSQIPGYTQKPWRLPATHSITQAGPFWTPVHWKCKFSSWKYASMPLLAMPPPPLLFSSSCLRRRSWLPVMTLQVSGCPHHIRNQEMLIYTFWVSWDSSQIPGYTQKPWRLPAAHSITQAGPFWTPVHWKCKFSSWKYASMPLLAMPPPPLLFSSCLQRRSWLPVMTLQVSGCPHHIRNQEMLIYTFWVSWDSSQIPGYTQKPWRLPAAHSITQAGPFWTPVHWKCKFSSWKYASMPLLAMPPPPLLFSSSCLQRRSWLPAKKLTRLWKCLAVVTVASKSATNQLEKISRFFCADSCGHPRTFWASPQPTHPEPLIRNHQPRGRGTLPYHLSKPFPEPFRFMEPSRETETPKRQHSWLSPNILTFVNNMIAV